MKYDLVIFDFDGTIVDLKVDWKKLKEEIKQFLLKQGYDLPHEIRINEVLNRYKNEREKILKKIKKAEMSAANKTHIENNVATILKRLHSKGLKMAIFSKNFEDTIKIVLKKSDIIDCFDIIVGRETLMDNDLRGKPHPDGIFYIIKNVGPSKNCIFVGNDTDDIKAAKKSGIYSLMISASKSQMKRRGADFIIKNFFEIEKYL